MLVMAFRIALRALAQKQAALFSYDARNHHRSGRGHRNGCHRRGSEEKGARANRQPWHQSVGDLAGYCYPGRS